MLPTGVRSFILDFACFKPFATVIWLLFLKGSSECRMRIIREIRKVLRALDMLKNQHLSFIPKKNICSDLVGIQFAGGILHFQELARSFLLLY